MTEFPLHRAISKGRQTWRIEIQALLDLAQPISSDLPPFMRTYGVALLFLKSVFGDEWLDRYVENAKPTGFLRKVHTQVTNEDIQFHLQRVVDLAEMIFNFQGVGGLDNCLDQLAGGDIEPTFAELDAAKLLHMYGVRLRFHRKGGKRGEDY